jgi:plasmid maintenance system antidote protein VapI/biotin operon repressor
MYPLFLSVISDLMLCVHITIVNNDPFWIKYLSMQTKDVFQFTTYKAIMKTHLRGSLHRGALSRAAEAMNCQRSYLSRVMNSKMQLTLDQTFTLCQHLKFSNDEREYFQTLVEYERAADRSYRDFLHTKIQTLKRKHESISEIVNKPKLVTQNEAIYFSAWYWSAIHFLSSVPEFQTVQKLSEKLTLPKETVLDCLRKLRDWGYVDHQGDHWRYSGGEFHLPKQSPFVAMSHQNWRSRAVIDSQNLSNENIHYTNIQTASLEDIAQLKELALEFIKECNRRLGPSTPEDGIVITLDLFKL